MMKHDITLEITDVYKQAQVIVDELESRFGNSKDFFTKSPEEQLNIIPIKRVINIWSEQVSLLQKFEKMNQFYPELDELENLYIECGFETSTNEYINNENQ